MLVGPGVVPEGEGEEEEEEEEKEQEEQEQEEIFVSLVQPPWRPDSALLSPCPPRCLPADSFLSPFPDRDFVSFLTLCCLPWPPSPSLCAQPRRAASCPEAPS